MPGLSFITKLKPVSYNFNTEKFESFRSNGLSKKAKESMMSKDFTASTELIRTGFLAQEVAGLCDALNYDFDGVSVSYTHLTLPTTPYV